MDHKIKDQKVFIKLGAVTALQRRYQRAVTMYQKAIGEVAVAAAKARMEAFQEAIAQLELPIS